MAITREKKEAIVAKVDNLLTTARLTIIARYTGLTVADMEALRKEARDKSVTVTVAKNRLVKLALAQKPEYQAVDASLLTGQVALAIGDDDVAPAQVLANFAKTHPALEIVGGVSHDGTMLSPEQIKALAQLPSQETLRAQLVGTIAAPLSGFVSVLSGNLRGLVNVLDARAKAIE